MESSLAEAQVLMDEGHRLRAGGDLEGAERAFRRAGDLAPGAAQPAHNLGVLAQLRGDWPAAEAAFRRALELEPNRPVSRAALGVALLAQARYAEGFPLADAARELPAGATAKTAPALPIPLWNGEDLAGKRLLVWSEEGFGDQIMFARFARRLQERGAQVSWLCPPPLARLFRECLGVDAIAAEGEVQLPEVDVYCPSSALPAVLMPKLIGPSPEPYFDLPPANAPPGARIGIMTASNPNHPNAGAKSIPPDLAARLLDIPGAISLAPEATGAKDFYDTAAIIAGLDLVVSVDTAVAHLTGALGKPLRVLMYEPAADWRWLQAREDSPWYATARVLRQPQPGDWRGLLDAVGRSLAEP
jgi:tetratricopeptide (TPR) repeat protein